IRRAAAGAVVLLLHVVALLGLLSALKPHLFQQTIGEREITITLPVTRLAPRTKEPYTIPQPTFLLPEISPRAITPPSLLNTPTIPEQQQEQGDIRALGRYLYNCSGAYYERLSAKEKAH